MQGPHELYVLRRNHRTVGDPVGRVDRPCQVSLQRHTSQRRHAHDRDKDGERPAPGTPLQQVAQPHGGQHQAGDDQERLDTGLLQVPQGTDPASPPLGPTYESDKAQCQHRYHQPRTRPRDTHRCQHRQPTGHDTQRQPDTQRQRVEDQGAVLRYVEQHPR